MFDFHQLARDVDARGIFHYEDGIGELAALARMGGVSPVLVDVMTDADQPEVARVRAMARVQLALGRTSLSYLAA